jgi:hypothetical protein
MQFYDTVVLDGVRKTRDGYLVGAAKTARTGIQTYSGRELDPNNELGLRDRAVVRVYRPEAEVFHKDALASMAHRPVTVDHPAEMVTAKNWKKYSVGMTGGDVVRDGEFVRIELTLMDQQAIDAWDAGSRELSWGYTSDLQVGDGMTPTGEAYDATMGAIRCNHLATCRTARGGPELRLGDHQPEGDPTVALKTIIVDGLPVETTDAGEAAVNKLRGMLGVADKALTDAQAAHATAIAAKDKAISDAAEAHAAAIKAKDTELGTKDARIAELEKQVVTGPALDALVTARAAVVARAKSLVPSFDATGKTDAEIRRAVVVAKLGDEKVKDKSDDYIGGLFDHLPGGTTTTTASDGGAAALRGVIADGNQGLRDAAAKADAEWKAAGADLNAWRTTKAA